MTRATRLVLATLAAASMLAPDPAAAQGTPAERVRRAVADDWETQLRNDPLLATSVGDPRWRDRLPSVGLADLARMQAERRALVARLRAIPRDSLDDADRIDRDVLLRERSDEIAYVDLLGHLIPITNREGFHTYFPDLPDRVPLRTVKDYEDYTARLRGFRAWAGQYAEVMREGMRRGMVLPRASVEAIPPSIRPHVVEDPTKSLLYAPFSRFPSSVPPAERARLERAGREAIASSVVPGYRDFLRFVEGEYLPAARATVGASALPGGAEYYAQRVRSYTTLDVTPDEVHRTGLAEVARIRAEMDAVIRSTGFTGTFAEFVAMLRSEPRFYAETPERLLERTSYVLKRMDGELPRLFGGCRGRRTASR